MKIIVWSSRDSFDTNDEGTGLWIERHGIFIAKWNCSPLLSVEKNYRRIRTKRIRWQVINKSGKNCCRSKIRLSMNFSYNGRKLSNRKRKNIFRMSTLNFEKIVNILNINAMVRDNPHWLRFNTIKKQNLDDFFDVDLSNFKGIVRYAINIVLPFFKGIETVSCG